MLPLGTGDAYDRPGVDTFLCELLFLLCGDDAVAYRFFAKVPGSSDEGCRDEPVLYQLMFEGKLVAARGRATIAVKLCSDKNQEDSTYQVAPQTTPLPLS